MLGVAEGAKEDKAGWSTFLRHLKERGLKGVQLFASRRKGPREKGGAAANPSASSLSTALPKAGLWLSGFPQRCCSSRQFHPQIVLDRLWHRCNTYQVKGS
jgi:hypothetical protein